MHAHVVKKHVFLTHPLFGESILRTWRLLLCIVVEMLSIEFEPCVERCEMYIKLADQLDDQATIPGCCPTPKNQFLLPDCSMPDMQNYMQPG